MIGPINHSPQDLRNGLLRATSPIPFDTETTGLNVRSDRILSLGFRIHGVNHILFTERCLHASINRYAVSDTDLRWALQPLATKDNHLVLVGHNLKFDLAMLIREGLPYKGDVRDTLGILRLTDQDRGHSTSDVGRDTTARIDLASPQNPRKELNYKLKDLAAQMCGIRPMYTPSKMMQLVPYRTHATYLAHDLYVTEKLFLHLWPRMSGDEQQYYQEVASPLLMLLVELSNTGALADTRFIDQQEVELGRLLRTLSDAHERQHGLALVGAGDWELRKLVFKTYGLPVLKGRSWKPSLDKEALKKLIRRTTDPPILDSLKMIQGFRQLVSLRQRIGAYRKHVDHRTGRIHSLFDNKQSTGRVSSTNPNLQQLAKKKKILEGTLFETEVFSRDMIVAPPRHILVAADIDQADARVLAHMIDSVSVTTEAHKLALLQERENRLMPAIRNYLPFLEQYRNKNYRGAPAEPPPPFDPQAPSRLFNDFMHLKGDLYATVATNITGRHIKKEDDERSTWKTVFLAQINGQTAKGLKDTLGCTTAEAKQHIQTFFKSYPDIESWIGLMKLQVALTGQTFTWAGRNRTMMAHRWMVAEPRVRVLMTYRNSHRYWYDVVPLKPTLRSLTSYVKRVWSVDNRNRPRLIYADQQGRIGTKWYEQLDRNDLLYCLPVRNLPWSNIRRVQRLDDTGQPVEEAKYEGMFDTSRSAINAIMQGGTMDVITQMMLRSCPVAEAFGARLILQVHDELVWEVPYFRHAEFIHAMQGVLQQPPTANFRVPMRVGFKRGFRFGQINNV